MLVTVVHAAVARPRHWSRSQSSSQAHRLSSSVGSASQRLSLVVRMCIAGGIFTAACTSESVKGERTLCAAVDHPMAAEVSCFVLLDGLDGFGAWCADDLQRIDGRGGTPGRWLSPRGEPALQTKKGVRAV